MKKFNSRKRTKFFLIEGKKPKFKIVKERNRCPKVGSKQKTDNKIDIAIENSKWKKKYFLK